MSNDGSGKKRKKNEAEESTSEAPEWMRSCLKFFDDHVPQAGGITEHLDQRFDTIEKEESLLSPKRNQLSMRRIGHQV